MAGPYNLSLNTGSATYIAGAAGYGKAIAINPSSFTQFMALPAQLITDFNFAAGKAWAFRWKGQVTASDASERVLVGIANSTALNGCYIASNAGKLKCVVNGITAGIGQASSVANDGIEHDVLLIVDTTGSAGSHTVKLYVDSTQVGSTASGTWSVAITQGWIMGWNASANYGGGQVAEVAIYKAALASGAALSSAEANNATNILGLWHFDGDLTDSALGPIIGTISAAQAGGNDTINYPAATAGSNPGATTISKYELWAATGTGTAARTETYTGQSNASAGAGSFTVASAPGGQTAFYAVKAYDNGTTVENSGFSNEVSQAGPAATTTATPPVVEPGGSALTVTVVGTGTSWISGTTVFSVSGPSGTNKVAASDVITNGTNAHFQINTGTGLGAITITNNTDISSATIYVVSAAATNAGIIYSPGNWFSPASPVQVTAYEGAYFRTIIKATTSISSRWDASHVVSAQNPQMAISIDGGPWTSFTPALLATHATGLLLGDHPIEVMYQAAVLGTDRFSATPAMGAWFLGLVGDVGCTVAAPAARKFKILVYGDSMTSGDRALGASTPDQTHDDATVAYPLWIGRLLDAEVGAVSASGIGILLGSGGYPALTGGSDGALHANALYNTIATGISRTLTGYDLIVYVDGTNDTNGSATVTTGQQNVIAAQSLAASKQVVVRPFSGNCATEVQNAATNTGANYVDTTGWVNVQATAGAATEDSYDRVHPTAGAHVGKIAPRLAAALFPILNPPNTGGLRRVAMTGGIVG